MAVEVANYNMRHVSASKWREQELFSWWFVHGMYHYTGLRGSSTVMNKTLFSSQTEMLLTFRPSQQKQSFHVCCVDVQLLVPYRNAWPCLIFSSVGFLEP